MNVPAYAIGQAIFIRTDTLDYAEESIPFKNLEELVRICTESHENLTLDKIVVYSLVEGHPSAVTLGFISASKGARPKNLDYFEQ
jgi:hypothetical protein